MITEIKSQLQSLYAQLYNWFQESHIATLILIVFIGINLVPYVYVIYLIIKKKTRHWFKKKVHPQPAYKKEIESISVASAQEKCDIKKYFESFSDEELVKKFKYFLYHSLIENTTNTKPLFSSLREFNYKRKKIYQKHRLSRVSEAIDLQLLFEDISLPLDINICLIMCEFAYQPIIKVLAIDHSSGGASVHGKYFHFDMIDMEMYCDINDEKGQRFEVCVKRTKYIGKVKIWLKNGGGSRGNAHGRFDQDAMEAIGNGYFQIGDEIEIIQRL